MNIYARTIRYFRPFALATAGGVGLTLVSIGFNLLKPWPFKFIVDGVLDSSAGTAETRVLLKEWFGATSPSLVVFWLCLAMVLISLLAGLVNLGSNYLFVRVGLQSLLKLRTDLYTALQNLPLKFHASAWPTTRRASRRFTTKVSRPCCLRSSCWWRLFL